MTSVSSLIIIPLFFSVFWTDSGVYVYTASLIKDAAQTSPIDARYVNTIDSSTPSITTSTTKELLREYQSWLEKPSAVSSTLKDGGVRYVVWDRQTSPISNIDILGLYSMVATSGPIYLIKLEQNQRK